MTTTAHDAPAILIAGYWLGSWAWDDVLEHLSAQDRPALAITLPGLDAADPDRSSRTLDDQVAAIERAIDRVAASEAEPVVLVAHSGANAPVSIVLDRHPARVRRVVWVDSGPVASGGGAAPDAPEELEELPLPPFEALAEQASLEGLSAEALARFRSRAVPEPGPVLRQSVELHDDARLRVPTTFVCCSISSTQLRELAASGHPMFAEVSRLEDVEFIDLPTGHWPMWSRPSELARIVAAAMTSPGK